MGNTACVYKGYNTDPSTILANNQNKTVLNGNNKRDVECGRWNIIAYSAPGNELPSPLVTIDPSDPMYLKIENLRTLGQ